MNLIRESERTTQTRILKATLINVVAMQRDDTVSNDALNIANSPCTGVTMDESQSRERSATQ